MDIQYVKDNTVWVVKHTWGRETLTGKQLDKLTKVEGEDFWEDVKDVEFLAEQPNKDIQKIIEWLIKEGSPCEDFKRNYCKYSKKT